MAEPRLVSPPSGSRRVAGQVFTAHCEQEIPPGGLEQGTACLQFSNDAAGPWTTCQAIGQGGALECNPVQWTRQATMFSLPMCAQHAAVYARVGVWPDQGMQGEPTYASDNEVSWPEPFERREEPTPPGGGDRP